MISRKGMDRAIARIIYELETIREEGYSRRSGLPTSYALDRLEAIRTTAQWAIDGNELACVGGSPRADIDVEPDFFDRRISTEVNPADEGDFLKRLAGVLASKMEKKE